MSPGRYSASRLIHGFVAAAAIGALAIIAVTAAVISDDRDLWLNLASEAAGVLLGGSVVAYLFERILRREEEARQDQQMAGVTLAASLVVNSSIGKVAILVSTALTRPLDLRAPAAEAPLRDGLESLADQLRERLGRPLDDVWDPDGEDAPAAFLQRLDYLHDDQLRAARFLVAGIVRALDEMRTAVVPLLQTVSDVELLTLISAADASRATLDELLADWETRPILLGPAHAFKQLPKLLTTLAQALGVIEDRTGIRFLYERPPVDTSVHGAR